MATTDVLKKLRLYQARPELVQELTPNEVAEIAILILNRLNALEQKVSGNFSK